MTVLLDICPMSGMYKEKSWEWRWCHNDSVNSDPSLLGGREFRLSIFLAISCYICPPISSFPLNLLTLLQISLKPPRVNQVLFTSMGRSPWPLVRRQCWIPDPPTTVFAFCCLSSPLPVVIYHPLFHPKNPHLTSVKFGLSLFSQFLVEIPKT